MSHDATEDNDSLVIRIERQHLVADCGGQLVLLDTGSPTSFGSVELDWRGRRVDLSKGLAAMPLDEINDAIGMPFVGLVGSDLLLEHPCLLDIKGGLITWNGVGANDPGCSFMQLMNVPIAEIPYGNVPRPFAVDTGASRTYVEADMAEGLERVGTVDDFYPGLGPFSADEIELRAGVAGVVVPIRAAVLPGELSSLMSMFGINGIIGLDVLQLSVFQLDPVAGVLSPAIELNAE